MGSSRQQGDPRVTNHLTGLFPDLEAIFEGAEAIQSLTGHPGWAHITRLLEAEADALGRQLDGMSDPLPYEKLCLWHGRRDGLLFALNAAQSMLTWTEKRISEQRAKHERTAEPVGG